MRRVIFFALMFLAGCSSDFERGRLAFQKKNYEDAVHYFLKVKASSEHSDEARKYISDANYEMGISAFENKDYKNAIAYFTATLDYYKRSDEYSRGILKYLSDAENALLEKTLDRYISERNIDGLNELIQIDPFKPLAARARKAKQDILKAFLKTQRMFEEKQKEFEAQYSTTGNDIRKSYIFHEANRWSIDYMKKNRYRIRYWKGKLSSAIVTLDGDNASVKIDSRTTSYRAKVHRSSPIYEKFLEIDEGDRVVFSGVFYTKDNVLSEYSWTELGRMDNPGFEIDLSGISLE